MEKDWNVEVTFKVCVEKTEYIFRGSEEEARQDAYLTFPKGSIRNVKVSPYVPDYEF